LTQHIPSVGNVYISVNCVKIVGDIKDINSSSSQWSIIIPLRSIKHRSLFSVITAVVSSFIYSTLYGAKIAKKSWIEPILYLEGERNIKRVIDKYELRVGDIALFIVISMTKPLPVESSSITRLPKNVCIDMLKEIPIDKKDITRISTFPIRERILK